jgi:hypothetical protein
MGKLVGSAAVLLLCLSCGGSTPPAETVEEPKAETPETPAPTEEAPAPEEGSGDDGGAGEAPSEGPKSEGGGSEKKSCAELDKNTCKITTGCGWNDVKKCVEEGASE